MQKAVILLSGGLDSATVLAMAKDQGYECYTLAFDYGQRHRSELLAAERISHQLGAKEHRVVSINLDSLRGSALTDKSIAVPDSTQSISNAGEAHTKPSSGVYEQIPSPRAGCATKPPFERQGVYRGDQQIPITYVPARNTIFLSVALGWAEILQSTDIFFGANAIDYSGYPDCRPEYIAAFEKLANLATKAGVEGKRYKIHAPLIKLTKAEIIKVGMGLQIDYAMTVSCYRATPEGLACGSCDSCVWRKKGFAEAEVPDLTRYV